MISGTISTGKAVALMAAIPTTIAASVAFGPPGSSTPCNKVIETGGTAREEIDGCEIYTICPKDDQCVTVPLKADGYADCGLPDVTEVFCNYVTGGRRPVGDPDGPCEGGTVQYSHPKLKWLYPNPETCG